jgi:hypothetical protein
MTQLILVGWVLDAGVHTPAFSKSKVPEADQGSPEIERVKSAVTFLPVATPKTG